MDRERPQIVFLAQATEFLALRKAGLVRTPLARTGGEDLKCIATQAIGTLGGILYASRNRRMNADPPRSERRRRFRRRLEQDVAFRLQKIRSQVLGFRSQVSDARK